MALKRESLLGVNAYGGSGGAKPPENFSSFSLLPPPFPLSLSPLFPSPFPPFPLYHCMGSSAQPLPRVTAMIAAITGHHRLLRLQQSAQQLLQPGERQHSMQTPLNALQELSAIPRLPPIVHSVLLVLSPLLLALHRVSYALAATIAPSAPHRGLVSIAAEAVTVPTLSGAPTPCPYQVPPTGGWGALQVQGPAFLVETARCLNHCFWNFTSGDGMLSKC